MTQALTRPSKGEPSQQNNKHDQQYTNNKYARKLSQEQTNDSSRSAGEPKYRLGLKRTSQPTVSKKVWNVSSQVTNP